MGRHSHVPTSLTLRSNPLHEIDTKDINRFVAEQKRAGSSNATIKHWLQTLRSAINLAEAQWRSSALDELERETAPDHG
jgi:hypothetical protein